MSKNTNLVIELGNLVKDPEIAHTATGSTYCKFTIANNQDYGDKKKVNFFDVVAWNKLAETAEKYLQKGNKVLVTGLLNQDVWEKDGQKFSRINIIANQIEFLYTGNNENKPAPMKDPYENTPASHVDMHGNEVNFDDVKGGDSSDIPF